MEHTAARVLLLTVLGAGAAILMQRLSAERTATSTARGETARLGARDQLRAEFIAGVSHDLRTPLTAVRAALGLLDTSAGERLRPEERELAVNARRNAERLGLVIDDLLTYNQLEVGALRLEREPLDLRTVAAEAVSSIFSLVREKGQAIELDVPEPLPVEGDARGLEQAIVNLLANAHRHTPEGAHFGISGRVVGREVHLAVSDDGPGIAGEDLEAVFRRFYRRGEGAGSGLGLANVRAIIELHGGRIRVENLPGGGTAFRIVLPRSGGDAEL